MTNVEINKLKEYKNNPRINDGAVDMVADSIKNFGFKNPIIIDKNYVIVCGHTRFKAAKKLGLTSVPCIMADDLNDDQIKAFRLVDNRTNEIALWDLELLNKELENIEMELAEFKFEEIEGFDKLLNDSKEVVEDEYEEPENLESRAKAGEIYKLGRHRLMCGDSTKAEDVEKLMGGVLADLLLTDPPYGMKKENEGVLNDNLNFEDLLVFNKKWIPLSFKYLKNNGSWYCWGIDEPLMDIYSNILKPMVKDNKITFRNLITWDKGNGQGQMSEDFRMYPIADEKCLFVMCGVQGFNTNADHYFEGWEPIRDYLLHSRLSMGWDVPTMKKIVGHSDIFRDHWTCKSQWHMPTREVYEKMQEEAEKQRKEKGLNNDAFKREYDDLKREYDNLKREYDNLKREYYSTRAYFDNTHDNMNNVWHFSRTSQKEKETTGKHATPKPIALCSRVIKTSSRENDNVLDLFGGSGSTLIACEQLNRNCYMMEYDAHYVDVIINRWEKLTGKKSELMKE